MNSFARYLRVTRDKRGLSLRKLGAGEIPEQTLSNYERGFTLPSPQVLPRLAKAYGVSFDEMKSEYGKALPRPDRAPLHEEPFLELLLDANKSDQLVVITQRSIVASRPEYASKIVQLAARGVGLTYVTYLPIDGRHQHSDWADNHRLAAPVIWREARRKGLQSSIRYLLIRNPWLEDYRFISHTDALVYLCRDTEDPVRDSTAWTEIEAPDGQSWWHPRNYKFVSALHDWLLYDCGLKLPSDEFDMPRTGVAKQRNIELQTLETFVAECGSHIHEPLGPK